MNEVLQRIERIKSVFLDTQSFYATHGNTDALTAYLENSEAPFRSIAYESASMAIALKDIENDEDLNDWLLFANGPALAHQAQVYVGLGWAIAKLNLPFLTAVKKIEPDLYQRVADGCGYYDGSFRQRQTVINQQLPVYIPEAVLPMYYQGVGRSLWYANNADINKIKTKIEGFPAQRHARLWRGMGVAVAYVGACDDEGLRTLVQYAAANAVQLAYGAALAVKSRMEANAISADTDRCSRFWYALTAGETKMISSDQAVIDHDAGYNNWMRRVE
jgi:hypothetical protein